MSNVVITSSTLTATIEISVEAEASVGLDVATKNPISANLKLLMAAFLSECARISGGVPPMTPPVDPNAPPVDPNAPPVVPPLPTGTPVPHTTMVLSILIAAVAAAEAVAV